MPQAFRGLLRALRGVCRQGPFYFSYLWAPLLYTAPTFKKKKKACWKPSPDFEGVRSPLLPPQSVDSRNMSLILLMGIERTAF